MNDGERPIHHKSTPTLLGRHSLLAVLSVILLLLSFCDPPFLIPLFQLLVEHKTNPTMAQMETFMHKFDNTCLHPLGLKDFLHRNVCQNNCKVQLHHKKCKVSIKERKQTKTFFQILFHHECHKLTIETVNE